MRISSFPQLSELGRSFLPEIVFKLEPTQLPINGWVDNHITCVICKEWNTVLCAHSLQLCLTLCHPMDYTLPGSSIDGILQTRILEWVATPSARGSSRPRDGPTSFMFPALAGGFFITSATCNGILKGRKCYNIDEPWRNYIKQNKPVTKRQIQKDSTYLRSLEKSDS